MKTYQFKTNINCNNCVSTVTPYINEEFRIENWKVDTSHPDKILTLETEEDLTQEEIINIVKNAGFEISTL